MLTPTIIMGLTDRDLQRELAHACNRRDAYAPGRAPERVMFELRALLDEQDRRCEIRREMRTGAQR